VVIVVWQEVQSKEACTDLAKASAGAVACPFDARAWQDVQSPADAGLVEGCSPAAGTTGKPQPARTISSTNRTNLRQVRPSTGAVVAGVRHFAVAFMVAMSL